MKGIDKYFRKAGSRLAPGAAANAQHGAAGTAGLRDGSDPQANKENRGGTAPAAVKARQAAAAQEVVVLDDDDGEERGTGRSMPHAGEGGACTSAPAQEAAPCPSTAEPADQATARKRPQADAGDRAVPGQPDAHGRDMKRMRHAGPRHPSSGSSPICVSSSTPPTAAAADTAQGPTDMTGQAGSNATSACPMQVDQPGPPHGPQQPHVQDPDPHMGRQASAYSQQADMSSSMLPDALRGTSAAANAGTSAVTPCDPASAAAAGAAPGAAAGGARSMELGSQQGARLTLPEVDALIEDVRAALGQELLLPTSLPSGHGAGQPQELPHAEVAALIEGRMCGLQQLVTQLAEQGAAKVPPAGAAAGAAEAGRALRESVLILAARKAYGLKEAGAEPDVEDTEPDMFWFWELRDHKAALTAAPTGPAAGGDTSKAADKAAAAAGTSNRKLADLYRRRRKELHELLVCGQQLRELLVKAAAASSQEAAPGKKPSKAADKERERLAKAVAKAADKLAKLHSVDQVEQALQAGIAAMSEKDTHRLAQLASKQQERQEAQEKRAADKEVRAAEKAKEAAAKAEKAAAREAKAAGFANRKELGKSQAMMASFLGKARTPAGKALQPGGLGAQGGSPPNNGQGKGPQPSGTSAASSLQLGADTPHTARAGSQAPAPGTGTAKEPRGLHAAAARLLQEELQQRAAAHRAALDPVIHAEVVAGPGAAGQQGVVALRADLRARCLRARQLTRSLRPERGVPPSWQRRQAQPLGAPPAPSFHERCQALFGEGYQPSGVRLLRRKLLTFQDSVRPCWYGANRLQPSHSAVVRGRAWLARDPGLDYEVESDQEWEEEPEGTDLCGPNSEEEEVSEVQGGEEDEEEEGFVVEDGYLSGDEGVHLEGADMDVDAAPRAGAEAGASAGPGMSDMAVLAAAVERQRKANVPFLLCALPGAPTEHPSHLTPRLLGALAGGVLRSGVVVQPPQEVDVFTTPPAKEVAASAPAATDAEAGPASGAAAAAVDAAAGVAGGARPGAVTTQAGAVGARGRPVQCFPEVLQPVLERFLRTTKDRALDKVVEGFLAFIGQANPAAATAPAAGTAPPGSTAEAEAAAPAAAAPAAAVPPLMQQLMAELGLPQPLPHVSKKSLKERIHMTGAYNKARGGWVINAVLATPIRPQPGGGSSQQGTAKTPGSASIKQHFQALHAAGSGAPTAAAAGAAPSPALCAAQQHALLQQPAATPTGKAPAPAGCPAGTPATAGPHTHRVLPTPLGAAAAANQLLACTGAGAGSGAGGPAGAPTPWPTPHTTIPAPGGAAGSLSAVAAAMDRTLPSSAQLAAMPYRYAPPPHHVVRGVLLDSGASQAAVGAAPHGGMDTPLTPIPCPLATPNVTRPQAQVGTQMAAPTPAMAGLPCVPANTPWTVAGPARAPASALAAPRGGLEGGSGSAVASRARLGGTGGGLGVDMQRVAERVQLQLLGAQAPGDTPSGAAPAGVQVGPHSGEEHAAGGDVEMSVAAAAGQESSVHVQQQAAQPAGGEDAEGHGSIKVGMELGMAARSTPAPTEAPGPGAAAGCTPGEVVVAVQVVMPGPAKPQHPALVCEGAAGEAAGSEGQGGAMGTELDAGGRRDITAGPMLVDEA